MKQYFNDAQMEVIYTGANKTVVCGGRGIGKGVIHAAWNLRNFQRMPGSITGIVGANGACIDEYIALHADPLGELGFQARYSLVHWQKTGGIMGMGKAFIRTSEL